MDDQIGIQREKEAAGREVTEIITQLENDFPGVTEGMAAALGAGAGGAGSLAALSALGVSGLSAAGITSGLAAAGSIVGGGMIAGIGVLAAPVAILGVGGYAVAKRRKAAKLGEALRKAISRLKDIHDRLMVNSDAYREEIAGVETAIDILSKRKPN